MISSYIVSYAAESLNWGGVLTEAANSTEVLIEREIMSLLRCLLVLNHSFRMLKSLSWNTSVPVALHSLTFKYTVTFHPGTSMYFSGKFVQSGMEHYLVLPNNLQICFFTVLLLCCNLAVLCMGPNVEVWVPVIFYQTRTHSAVNSVGSVVPYPFFVGFWGNLNVSWSNQAAAVLEKRKNTFFSLSANLPTKVTLAMFILSW